MKSTCSSYNIVMLFFIDIVHTYYIVTLRYEYLLHTIDFINMNSKDKNKKQKTTRMLPVNYQQQVPSLHRRNPSSWIRKRIATRARTESKRARPIHLPIVFLSPQGMQIHDISRRKKLQYVAWWVVLSEILFLIIPFPNSLSSVFIPYQVSIECPMVLQLSILHRCCRCERKKVRVSGGWLLNSHLLSLASYIVPCLTIVMPHHLFMLGRHSYLYVTSLPCPALPCPALFRDSLGSQSMPNGTSP